MNMHMKNQRGMTLIELMISVTLGLLIMAGIGTLFVQMNQSARQNDLIAGMQENARFAMNLLSDDLRAAGLLGGVTQAVDIDGTLANPTSDCGTAVETNWLYTLNNTGGASTSIMSSNHILVEFLPSATAAAANTSHQCIDTAKFEVGTDVLAIKRTASDTSTGALTDNRAYLRTNGTTGFLWWYNASTSPSPTSGLAPIAGGDDWEYLPRIYYIRNFSIDLGDGIPSLCRKYLTVDGGNPTAETECLAEGIEDFHVEFGIDDVDANGDGFPDNPDGIPLFYATTLPANARYSFAVTARIYVLARSLETDPAKTTTSKTYNLGTKTVTRDDKYYRKVYTTTVLLRNFAAIALF